MVTTPTAPPPVPPRKSTLPPPPPPTPSRVRDIAARLREAAAGTPGTMRLLGVGTVVVLVVFGILAALSANSRTDAIDQARAEAAQLVRFQTVRTNLVQADALATNAFLVGGLEPKQQRDDYLAGLAAATAALTDAAAASEPADAEAIRNVGQSIVTYAGLVESARANNRQGFPVGVAYLKQASTLLQVNVLPVLANLSDTTQSRVKDAYRDSRSATEWLATGAFIAIVMLLITQGYLTVRSRRLVSVPVATAVGIVAVATVAATAVLAWSQSQADDVRDSDYRATVALAQARIFAFDAKSAESLTLVLRGSGQAQQQRFETLSTAAGDTLQVDGLDEEHVAALDAYLALHRQVRDLDDSGNWDDAVLLATQQVGGSNAAFDRFDDSTNAELSERSSNIADDLDRARTPLPVIAVLMVLAGIAAAVAAWQGISTRLREYR
jgi:hypothetical protein